MSKSKIVIALVLIITVAGFTSPLSLWLRIEKSKFNIYYTESDSKEINNYITMLESGVTTIEDFFQDNYRGKFDVYIHTNRTSLDKQWQKDWNNPDLKSECWMVASGLSSKMDIVSPLTWEKEKCEHSYADKIKTQKLFTHELVHVYHGKLNKSPDFTDIEGIDWLVEGLATYVSGQCDELRIRAVQKAINENAVPESLDKFWTGKLSYGLSGTMLMYIDKKYGREMLKSLLPLNKLNDVLVALKTDEYQLIKGWREFVTNYQ